MKQIIRILTINYVIPNPKEKTLFLGFVIFFVLSCVLVSKGNLLDFYIIHRT